MLLWSTAIQTSTISFSTQATTNSSYSTNKFLLQYHKLQGTCWAVTIVNPALKSTYKPPAMPFYPLISTKHNKHCHSFHQHKGAILSFKLLHTNLHYIAFLFSGTTTASSTTKQPFSFASNPYITFCVLRLHNLIQLHL
jgi:hypothetical protein